MIFFVTFNKDNEQLVTLQLSRDSYDFGGRIVLSAPKLTLKLYKLYDSGISVSFLIRILRSLVDRKISGGHYTESRHCFKPN